MTGLNVNDEPLLLGRGGFRVFKGMLASSLGLSESNIIELSSLVFFCSINRF